MKNYIIVLTALIIVGCSREYKAQKVVKDFIKESSIGKKYKSIYFGALDSIYTGIFDYPEYKAVFDELRYAINTYDNYSDEQKLYDARWAIRNDPSLYRRYSRMYIWDQRTMEENMIDLICKNAEKHIANIQAKQDSISSAYYKLNIPKGENI